MTNQSIALVFGFLAFTLSILPVTTVKADCQAVTDSLPHCPEGTAAQGERVKINAIGRPVYTLMCCTVDAPSGGEPSPRPVKSMKKIKGMGPGSQSGKKALRNACNSQNWVWNEETGRCKRPSRVQAECEARGPKFRYNLDTGRCVKHVSMSREQNPSDSDKAECEARGRKFRYDPDTGRCVKHVSMSKDQGSSGQEFEDEDFQPKKEKEEAQAPLGHGRRHLLRPAGF